MAMIGYIRAVTDAEIKSQHEELKAAGCTEFYTDRAGFRDPRPHWDTLLHCLEANDTVVVTDLCRMIKTIKHLYKFTKHLEAQQISLVSLHDGIDTREEYRGCFFKVITAISTLEKAVVAESNAKTPPKPRGRSGGRKPLPQATMASAVLLFRSGEKTADEVAKMFNISRKTLFNYLNKQEDGDKAEKLSPETGLAPDKGLQSD